MANYKCVVYCYDLNNNKQFKKFYSSRNRSKIFAIYFGIKNKLNKQIENILYEDCKMFINDYPCRRYEKRESN